MMVFFHTRTQVNLNTVSLNRWVQMPAWMHSKFLRQPSESFRRVCTASHQWASNPSRTVPVWEKRMNGQNTSGSTTAGSKLQVCFKKKYQRFKKFHTMMAFKLLRFTIIKWKSNKKITIVLFNYPNFVRILISRDIISSIWFVFSSSIFLWRKKGRRKDDKMR